jgi:hypothetical protein
MKKETLIIAFVLFFCVFACDNIIVASSDNGAPNANKEINNGFVFIDGKYLPPPYTISRDHLDIKINNHIIKKPARHPGGPILSLESPFIRDPNQVKSKDNLINWLDSTVPVYKYYLEEGYCYLFSSKGGHDRLDTYRTAFDLPERTDISKPSDLLQRLKQKVADLINEKEFGKNNGKQIDSGYVFFEGEYIEAPYRVDRVGTAIFINDTTIEKPDIWPKQIYDGNEDVEMPKEINQYTSIYDPIFKEFSLKKAAYLRKTMSPDKEKEIMEAMWRKLPFVVSAKLDGNDPSILHITTTSGETIPISLVSFRRQIPDASKEGLTEKLNQTRKSYEDMLERGTCYFFFNRGGHIRFSEGSAEEKLTNIITISKSAASLEERTEQLKNLIHDTENERAQKILKNFRVTPQLEERIHKK